MLALGSAWGAGGPSPLATLSPLTMGPTHEAGGALVKGRWQLPHPTFDFQPLLVVFLLILIRRLEDTWAAGHRQLLGMHIVLHLARWATDERGPLSGAGEYSSGGTGRARWGILG